jgi:4-hydroxyphenylpyruvate dioxygenase-like putative hemolysin
MNFLPSWIFHLLFIAGVLALVASFVLKAVPLLTQYRIPVQIAAVAAILIATWFEGAISNQNAWVARVKEMEAKVAKAEEQSQQVNTVIKEKIVKQIEVVKTRGDDVIRYVDREIIKYDTKFAAGGQCEIPAEFIKAHNQAAEKVK